MNLTENRKRKLKNRKRTTIFITKNKYKNEYKAIFVLQNAKCYCSLTTAVHLDMIFFGFCDRSCIEFYFYVFVNHRKDEFGQ